MLKGKDGAIVGANNTGTGVLWSRAGMPKRLLDRNKIEPEPILTITRQDKRFQYLLLAILARKVPVAEAIVKLGEGGSPTKPELFGSEHKYDLARALVFQMNAARFSPELSQIMELLER